MVPAVRLSCRPTSLFGSPVDTNLTIWRSRFVSPTSAFPEVSVVVRASPGGDALMDNRPPAATCRKSRISTSGSTSRGTIPYAPVATAKIDPSSAGAARRTIRVWDPSDIADAKTLTPDAIDIELSSSAISGERSRIALSDSNPLQQVATTSKSRSERRTLIRPHKNTGHPSAMTTLTQLMTAPQQKGEPVKISAFLCLN